MDFDGFGRSLHHAFVVVTVVIRVCKAPEGVCALCAKVEDVAAVVPAVLWIVCSYRKCVLRFR